MKPLDAQNLQRPETVESLSLMWRVTQDPTYREWEWKIFQSLQKYEQLENGAAYTSLNDINAIPPLRRDNMESFWLVSSRCVPFEALSRYRLFGLTGRNSEVPVPALLTK